MHVLLKDSCQMLFLYRTVNKVLKMLSQSVSFTINSKLCTSTALYKIAPWFTVDQSNVLVCLSSWSNYRIPVHPEALLFNLVTAGPNYPFCSNGSYVNYRLTVGLQFQPFEV